jgi:hypothetical protein
MSARLIQQLQKEEREAEGMRQALLAASTCPICTISLEHAESIQIRPCNHELCVECAQQHAMVSFRDRTPLLCPTCPVAQALKISPEVARSWLSDEMRRQLHVQRPTGQTAAEGPSDKIKCPSCMTRFVPGLHVVGHNCRVSKSDLSNHNFT